MRRTLLAWLIVAGACSAERAPAANAPPAYIAVSAGENHTCALASDGAVFCWGAGGQLGPTGGAQHDRPLRVPSGVAFAAIAAGGAQTCALSRDGDPYCWGGSEFREAGGTGERVRVPTRVPGVPKLTMLVAGPWVTCGVTVSGEVVCWGRLTRGGRGSSPTTVPRAGAAYASVSASQTHACAITTDGGLLCWGSDHSGALGRGAVQDTIAGAAPGPVASQERFVSVNVAASQSCGVTRNGDAYCWGYNRVGQLGNSRLDGAVHAHPVPERVGGEHKWQVVASGIAGTCGITTAGRVLCWGGTVADDAARAEGWTACPDNALIVCSALPRSVGADSVRFTMVDGGGSHFCALATGGDVYCWGFNDWGQLGVGPAVAGPGSSVPRRVTQAQRSSTPEPAIRRAPAETIRLQPTNPLPVPGPEPNRITWDGKITMTLHGAVSEAVITDPLGRRLGSDPGARTAYSEIPDAVYDSSGLGTLRDDSIADEDPLWKEIYLNEPADGDYRAFRPEWLLNPSPDRTIASWAPPNEAQLWGCI
ncbi:MAG TPA: hypothetical protein VEK77_01835 [Gemmatimonadales bacterium]|nr:hypothetical protein [Gemmatimonadales bacterium]